MQERRLPLKDVLPRRRDRITYAGMRIKSLFDDFRDNLLLDPKTPEEVKKENLRMASWIIERASPRTARALEMVDKWRAKHGYPNN